ncbi:MAG TPA: nucleoside kinase [Tissierellaceae bacterium]|nr:nucleoside kinase [Tissierellaceae bacterium]
MKKEIKINVKGMGEVFVEKGAALKDISKDIFKEDYKNYLGAKINNEIFNLNTKVEEFLEVEFLDISNVDGHRIYTKTISAVFIMACKRLFPERTVEIQHFLGEGLYTEFERGHSIDFKDIKDIKKEMEKIIKADYSITRKIVSKDKAIELFKENNYIDKIRLFNTLNRESTHIYNIGEHIDTFHGFLAPSTGFVENYQLKYYYPGALIVIPNKSVQDELPEFKELTKLSKVFKETNDWAEILDLSHVGSLNEKIINGEISEVIKIAEALHEKKIGKMADVICRDEEIHLILIAGPSSSGKTTLAKRLEIHLKVNGKKPISISVDDYFVNREDTPLNEHGDYDFEILEAIDLKKLNEDLISLLEGKQIELPKFNFITGKRERSGKIVQIDKNQPIIVEGIHSLNPKMTSYIPEKNKYKIYISALTQLNIDAHNRIPTTDTRIIRRMVRDVKYRGNDANRTFEMWEGVRKGEEKYIFPFQEEADIMFDSALVYELAVLKKHAIPLLKEIDNSNIYYSEAKKLLKFLQYFRDITDESVITQNSILKEFIG